MKHIRAGSGDILVLVHGALADASMWKPHIEHLKSDFEVVAVSQRHFDGVDNGGFGLNTHADDLAEFLEQLSAEKPVHILGWSYGADVVLNMLIKHDVKLASALVYELGYPGCLSGSDMEAWNADTNRIFPPVFEYFSQGEFALAVEALIDGTGNRKGYFMSLDEELRSQLLDKKETLAYQLTQKEKPDITEEELSKLDVPLLVAHGSKTRDMFRLVSRKVATTSDRASLKILEGEGHMLPFENPAKFSSFILKQLKGK